MSRDDSCRYQVTMRQIEMLLALTARGYSARELAEKFHVSIKTVRRQLVALERSNIPLVVESVPSALTEDGRWYYRYRVDKHWALRFVPERVCEFWEQLEATNHFSVRAITNPPPCSGTIALDQPDS